MGCGPCDDHDCALPARLVRIRARLVLRCNFLIWIHADDLYEPAERQCLDTVFGLPTRYRPDRGTEAEEELRSLEVKPFGSHEVARLVNHDNDRERRDEDRNVHVTAALRRESTALRASERAHASTFSTASRSATSAPSWNSSVSATTAGMSSNPRDPARKACTATSFAALRTAGNEPPARPAS